MTNTESSDTAAAQATDRLRKTILWIFLGIPGGIFLLWMLYMVLSGIAADGPTPVLFG